MLTTAQQQFIDHASFEELRRIEFRIVRHFNGYASSDSYGPVRVGWDWRTMRVVFPHLSAIADAVHSAIQKRIAEICETV